MTKAVITLVEDPETGDLIMPIPDDIWQQTGWEIGDTLVWKDEGNGSFSVSKKVEKEGEPNTP
jgi:hypothetical protein